MTSPVPPSLRKAPRIPLRQAGELDESDRRGMRLWARVLLVLVVEAFVVAWIGIGRSGVDLGPTVWLVSPVWFPLGLAVTTQAHHRLPLAWHVLVVIAGYLAAFSLVAWGALVLGHVRLGGFDTWYWGGLGWVSLVLVELSCLLALVRPAGSSYMTRQKLAQAQQAS